MFQRVRRETIIAVNVGGCLIPVALAIYETAHLAMAGRQALIGADLLHLRDIKEITTGIGGVGTFDGIVLPGVVAAYLA